MKKVRKLTEHQRVGELNRKNLAEQLILPHKAIQEKKTEVEPKKAQSMEVGEVEVEKSRYEGNLGAVRTGPGNKEKLPAEEPIASSWPSRNPEDRNIIHWGRQNRLCYEQYGDRHNNYNPYYDYYAACAQNNRLRMPTYKTEISPPIPNRPLRKLPFLEKENKAPIEKSKIRLSELASRGES